MAWTWVTEDFNRSDRQLDGDTVDSSALTWDVVLCSAWSWSSSGLTSSNKATIASNAPRSGATPTDYNGSLLLADITALAGSTILGVGVEVGWSSPLPSQTAPDGKHYAHMFAGIPSDLGGTLALLTTNQSTATIYQCDIAPEGSTFAWRMGMGGLTAAGAGASGAGISNFNPLDGFSVPKWLPGDVVRFECVFGGSTTSYYNGTLKSSVTTPAAITLANGCVLVGANVNDMENSDNWKVGVLT